MQAISNSLWSYSKLAYNPGHRVLDVAARRAAGMLHQYTSQVRAPASPYYLLMLAATCPQQQQYLLLTLTLAVLPMVLCEQAEM